MVGHLFVVFLMIFTPLSVVNAKVDSASINLDAAQQYEKGLVEFNAGEYDTAVIHLKNALLEDQKYLSAHILLGKIYLKQGYGALAEKELNKAQELGADKSLILEELAQALMLQVKYRKVIDTIFPEQQTDKVNASLLVYRAQSYFQLGEMDKSRQEFNDALKLDGQNINALLGLAEINIAYSSFEEAQAYISRALDIDSQNPTVWYYKGAWHHAQGKIDGASKGYLKALEIDPDHFNSKLSYAGLFMDKGEFESAKKAFLSLYKSSPKNPQIAYFIAAANLSLGNNSSAKEHLREAKTHLESLSEDAVNEHGPTLMLAGLIHYDLGEYQVAKTYLSSYVARLPEDIRSRLILGRIYLIEGNAKKAIAALEPGLSISADNFQLLVMLGDAYMQKKDYFKASQVFAQASKFAPTNSDLKTKMGINALQRGQTENGFESLRAAVELDKQASAAGFILVTTLMKQGRLEEALAIADRLVIKHPENLLLQNLHASTQLQAGLRQEARSKWETILKKAPDFNIAKINLIKLDISEGKIKQAEPSLFELLEESPDNPIYISDLARIQQFQGKTTLAIKNLEKAVKLAPQNYSYSQQLVSLYIRLDESGKAVKVASQLVSKTPDSEAAYLLLGRSQLAFGEPYKAASSLKKASQIASYDSQLLRSIAELQIEAQDLTGALYSLEKYLDIHNKDPQGWNLYVQAKLALDAASDIEFSTSKLTELGYEALSKRLLGDQAVKLNSLHRAEQFYEESLQMLSVADTAVQLFKVLTQQKGMLAAADFLAGWLKENPENPPLREILARAYVTVGDYDSAQWHLEKLMNENWESAVAYANQAYVYDKKNLPEAEDIARKALSLNNQDFFTLDTLGWILVKKGQLDEGLRLLRDAFSRNSQSTSVRYHLAYSLHQLERYEEAKEQLNWLFNNAVNFPEKEDARLLLSTIK